MKVYRQGDVVIKPFAGKIPADMKDKPDLVLAEGETTGHMHRITQGKAELQVNALLGLMILKVLSDEGAVLSHEEHNDVFLPKGEYEVKMQREWDWYENVTRRVAD